MSEQSNGHVREEQRTRMFNPNEHLVQLKSRQGSQDYLPVQWRLVWFRENCPQGTIDTEEVMVDLDREVEVEAYVWSNEKRRSEKVTRKARGYARFRAVVTDGKGGRATGTKSENAANFQDYIEKAETGAIGRALAALGYGTQFAPELNEEHRIVDSPVERGNGNGNHAGTSNAPTYDTASTHDTTSAQDATNAAVTEQQISSIRKLCQHLGKNEPENVTSISYLNAKKIIQQLTAEYKEQRQSSKAS
jgi:hypothetical protein